MPTKNSPRFKVPHVNAQAMGVAAVAVVVLAGVLLGVREIQQKTSPIRDGSRGNTTIRLKMTDHAADLSPLQNEFGNPTDTPYFTDEGQIIPLDRDASQNTNLLRFEGTLEYHLNGGGQGGL